MRKPAPLPAQALDHGTGYLLAAAVCRALSDGIASANLSLARTARLLVELGSSRQEIPEGKDEKKILEKTVTAWGPVMQVPCPGAIEGYEVRWREQAGPLGRHEPRWADES